MTVEYKKNVDVSVITSSIKDHLNIINASRLTFIISKNSDGRKGFWVNCKEHKYKLLFAKSGTIRAFFTGLNEVDVAAISSAHNKDCIIEADKNRAMFPTKPVKMEQLGFRIWFEYLNSLEIKKGSPVRKTSSNSNSTPTVKRDVIKKFKMKKGDASFTIKGKAKTQSAKLIEMMQDAFMFFRKDLNCTQKWEILIKGGHHDSTMHGFHGYDQSTQIHELIIPLTPITRKKKLNSIKYMLQCIAHECTHAQQMESGRLSYAFDKKNNRWHHNWMGKDYKRCAWENRPWEQEALKNESVLVDKYMTERGLEDMKITKF